MTPLGGTSRSSDRRTGGRERPYSSETEVIGDAGVVAVTGEMDLFTSTQFRRDIDEAITLTSGDLVLDFSDLDMIDSTALGVMLGAQRRLTDEGRWLILVVTQRHVMRVLAITGLHTTFRIALSRHEALRQVVGAADPRRVT